MAITINDHLCIYRLGIAELQVKPLNPLISEKISINSDVDSSIYARTNAFVSYTNTIKSYNLTFTFSNVHNASILYENVPEDQAAGAINSETGGVTSFMRAFQSLLYANYDQKNDSTDSANRMYARTIKSPPIFKIRYGGFIVGNDDISGDGFVGKKSGLLGSITNVNIDPFYTIGYVPFSPNQARDMQNVPSELISYTQCKFSFDFIPLYDEPLGWNTTTDAIGGSTLKFSNNKQFRSFTITDILGD